MTPDVTVAVTFHQERSLAVPAMKSLKSLIDASHASGCRIEALAILDRSDKTTESLVRGAEPLFDRTLVVDFGDLALSRNCAVDHAKGRYFACLDGDDLWGRNWISDAWLSATRAEDDTIFHPEWLYYFSAANFDFWTSSVNPVEQHCGFFMRQTDSCDEHFDNTCLLLNNVWSANCLARTEVFRRYPYKQFERAIGFGIEDWTWNIATLWGGINHRSVPGTAHLIRLKTAGSLGMANFQEGLLPQIDLAPDVALNSNLAKNIDSDTPSWDYSDRRRSPAPQDTLTS